MDWLEETDFARASISQRCITIRGKTCVLETNHVFESVPKHLLCKEDLQVSSCQRLDGAEKEILTLRNKSSQMISFAIKSPPASRKCDTAGP